MSDFLLLRGLTVDTVKQVFPRCRGLTRVVSEKNISDQSGLDETRVFLAEFFRRVPGFDVRLECGKDLGAEILELGKRINHAGHPVRVGLTRVVRVGLLAVRFWAGAVSRQGNLHLNTIRTVLSIAEL